MSPTRPTGPSGGQGPHVFVPDVDAPELDEGDRHHLAHVLRLRPGDRLTLSDGAGRWRTARFGLELTPEGDVRFVAPPRPPITVAFAPVKGERPEWAIQKLTEVGVDRIVPFRAARSVVRWDKTRETKHLARLRRVAREAAMQCHRTWLPEVAEVEDFAGMVAQAGAVLAERGGDPPGLDRPLVLIGPEGGWAPEELAAAPSTVGLGAHVLRAETAAVTAGTLLAALRAGLVTQCG